jgi:hypothetical protein
MCSNLLNIGSILDIFRCCSFTKIAILRVEKSCHFRLTLRSTRVFDLISHRPIGYLEQIALETFKLCRSILLCRVMGLGCRDRFQMLPRSVRYHARTLSSLQKHSVMGFPARKLMRQLCRRWRTVACLQSTPQSIFSQVKEHLRFWKASCPN